jgi:tRNA-dihydrouridine synthase
LAAAEGVVPLVVQLIGHGEALVSAALAAQAAGAYHINLNLGCPYGRTTSASTGGALLRQPAELAELLISLRKAIAGTFSVKLRAGYDDPHQVFSLLPLFEKAEVDFLIIHPRTVQQEYDGAADHTITAEVVRLTKIPVIANGDILTARDAERIMDHTGAAGLMLGRGAIADPQLFQRIRGTASIEPTTDELRAMIRHYLSELLPRYRQLFCGDAQVLAKLQAVMKMISLPDRQQCIKKVLRAKNLQAFVTALSEL